MKTLFLFIKKVHLLTKCPTIFTKVFALANLILYSSDTQLYYKLSFVKLVLLSKLANTWQFIRFSILLVFFTLYKFLIFYV